MREQLVFIKGMGTGRWNDPVMTPIPVSIYELDSGFFKKINWEGGLWGSFWIPETSGEVWGCIQSEYIICVMNLSKN